jgi:hypothetical protein
MNEIPNLQGLVAQKVEIACRRIWQAVQDLTGRVDKLPTQVVTQAQIDKLQTQIAALQNQGTQTKTVVVSTIYTTSVNIGVVAEVDSAAFLPTGLGEADAEALVYVKDKAHTLRWTGTGWDWARGDDRSGYWRICDIDPGTGWHKADGSTVQRLESNGTLFSLTLPDYTTPGNELFLKLGGTAVAANAAVAPTFTQPTAASASTGISATTSSTGSTQSETASGGSTVPTAAHTHPVNITDPTHTHTISGGAVAADGQPKHTIRIPYYRL